jgi:hypothetical protein
MDYEFTSNETLTAVDHVWLPSHLRHHEVLTAIDTTRVERITFNLTHAEVVTAVDSGKVRVNRVGEKAQGWRFNYVVGTEAKGWKVEPVQKEVHEDLGPGETLTFTVEDYFDYRTLLDGNLRLHNTEGRTVHIRVVQNIIIEGITQPFVIVDENMPGHGYRDVPIAVPITLPLKPALTPMRLVSHVVTFTNQEASVDATVVAAITGWAGRSTSWPVDSCSGDAPCELP